MNRREFVRLNTVVLAGLALDACSRASSALSRSDSPLPPTDGASFARARRFATTSFGKIAYLAHGSGPAALFLHGYPLNGFQWRGAIARLRSVRHCIAPDLMGLGYSDVQASQTITPSTQVQMLAALLDRLGVGACDAVANDSGGMTDKTIAPALANKSAARSARGIGGIGYANPLNPTVEAVEMYFAPIVSSDKRKAEYDALTIGLGRNSLDKSAEKLRELQGPVRIVWAADDTVFAKASARWLDETFPNSRGVRFVEHAKLFFPEEQSDVIAAEARLLWNV